MSQGFSIKKSTSGYDVKYNNTTFDTASTKKEATKKMQKAKSNMKFNNLIDKANLGVYNLRRR